MSLYENILGNVSAASVANKGIVKLGYGQVEPNHLSARRTGHVYAQLPAAAAITKLENGQYVKYDYPNGVVNFTGAGEWMLVYNEVKVYRDEAGDCEFAMLKNDYLAKVYSPLNPDTIAPAAGVDYSKITTEDPFALYGTTDPYMGFEAGYKEQLMPADTRMVPRVLGTQIGDIYTTNLIRLPETEKTTLAEIFEEIGLGDMLTPAAADGILEPVADDATPTMKWQVVKKYTMPDGQPGVKLMRVL